MRCIRFCSLAFAFGRQDRITSLTCNDEPKRTAVDDRHFIAKVGVAGSNPVVRSKNLQVKTPFRRSRGSGRPRFAPNFAPRRRLDQPPGPHLLEYSDYRRGSDGLACSLPPRNVRAVTRN
jgi:hypothetical protein